MRFEVCFYKTKQTAWVEALHVSNYLLLDHIDGRKGSDITICTIWWASGSAGEVYVGISMFLFDPTDPLPASDRASKGDESISAHRGSHS